MNSRSVPAAANRPSFLVRHWAAAVAVWLALVFCVIYIPDIGRGFIKDDYPWIATSRLTSWSELPRLFVETPMGFYRPLVALSFALTTPLAQFAPLPYALTNLAIALAIGGAIVGLARRLGLEIGAAVFAAAVWLFNFHGINMSVLWISGRTSLLGTLGAVLAAWAFAAARPALAGVVLLIALLGKEEPLLLPIVFAIWLAVDRQLRVSTGSVERFGAAVRQLAPALLSVAAYLLLRAQTAAFTPASAPDFYQPRLGAIGDNIVQYADRALTFPALVVGLGLLLVRGRVSLSTTERGVVMKGLAWLVFGYGLTILLPVRSSLYACLPSVGAALAAAAIASAQWRAVRRPRLVVAALLLLPALLWPVYRARNQRLRAEATLAASTLQTVSERIAAGRPSRIRFFDDRAHRPSLSDAFGEWLPVATLLVFPETEGIEIEVGPSSDPAAAQREPGLLNIVIREGRVLPPAP